MNAQIIFYNVLQKLDHENKIVKPFYFFEISLSHLLSGLSYFIHHILSNDILFEFFFVF